MKPSALWHLCDSLSREQRLQVLSLVRVAAWKTAGYEYCQVPKETNGIIYREKRRESPGTVYGRVLDGERREPTATTADAWTDDGRRSASLSLSLSSMSVSSLSCMRLRLRDEQVGVQCYQGTQRRQEPLPGPRLVIRNSTFHLPLDSPGSWGNVQGSLPRSGVSGELFRRTLSPTLAKGIVVEDWNVAAFVAEQGFALLLSSGMVEHRLCYNLSEDGQFI
ncbi:hypothetical protein K0M31_003929 [Melipona bicolor]|uniref:Uncharacterized protein n=1 Tax=Melipona bicolor TaxID=60889 RepID=A0AA40FXU6_9HYME|nr:hypothetical protein K0M31_003929 [Melipona bicolor]